LLRMSRNQAKDAVNYRCELEKTAKKGHVCCFSRDNKGSAAGRVFLEKSYASLPGPVYTGLKVTSGPRAPPPEPFNPTCPRVKPNKHSHQNESEKTSHAGWMCGGAASTRLQYHRPSTIDHRNNNPWTDLTKTSLTSCSLSSCSLVVCHSYPYFKLLLLSWHHRRRPSGFSFPLSPR
jgi:hypothetical protein